MLANLRGPKRGIAFGNLTSGRSDDPAQPAPVPNPGVGRHRLALAGRGAARLDRAAQIYDEYAKSHAVCAASGHCLQANINIGELDRLLELLAARGDVLMVPSP